MRQAPEFLYETEFTVPIRDGESVRCQVWVEPDGLVRKSEFLPGGEVMQSGFGPPYALHLGVALIGACVSAFCHAETGDVRLARQAGCEVVKAVLEELGVPEAFWPVAKGGKP